MRPAADELTAHESPAGAWGIPELMPPVGGGCTTAHESPAGAWGILECMPPIGGGLSMKIGPLRAIKQEESIMGKYFGTDGFRGEANVDLTVEHAYKVGRFLGW